MTDGKYERVNKWYGAVAITVPALMLLVASVISSIRRPLWRDEFATWSFASLNVDEMLSAVSHVDAVLAPYYFVVHVVYLVIPFDFGLRILSIVAGTVTVILVSLLSYRWWGATAAISAGLLLTFNPLFFEMSGTARPYALACMFVAMSASFLVRAISPGRQIYAWIGYGVSVCACGLMHLMALLAIVAMSVLIIGAGRMKVVAWICSSSVAALIVAPIAVSAFSQRGQVSWIPSPEFRTVLGSLASLIVFRADGRLSQLEAVALLLVSILLVGGLLLILARLKGAERNDEIRRFAFALALFIFPWAFLVGESLAATPFLRTTYLMPSVLGLSLGLAAVVHQVTAVLGTNAGSRSRGVGPLRRPLQWGAAGLAVVMASVLALAGIATATALRAPWWVDNFPGLASAMSSTLAVGDTVISVQHYSETGVNAGIARTTQDLSFGASVRSKLIAGTQTPIELRRVTSMNPIRTVDVSSATDGTPIYLVFTRGGVGSDEVGSLAAIGIVCALPSTTPSKQSFGLLRFDSDSCRVAGR